jgi:2,3,4,5-tetrahydropyridine-2,6-dicarboxylate N-succinyltransferase
VTRTATKAWGFGLATLDSAGNVLDVWFPSPALGEAPADATEPEELTALAGKDDARDVVREVVKVEVEDLSTAPASTQDVWLRLHLISTRQCVPHSISMDGVFALLTNVV